MRETGSWGINPVSPFEMFICPGDGGRLCRLLSLRLFTELFSGAFAKSGIAGVGGIYRIIL